MKVEGLGWRGAEGSHRRLPPDLSPPSRPKRRCATNSSCTKHSRLKQQNGVISYVLPTEKTSRFVPYPQSISRETPVEVRGIPRKGDGGALVAARAQRFGGFVFSPLRPSLPASLFYTRADRAERKAVPSISVPASPLHPCFMPGRRTAAPCPEHPP